MTMHWIAGATASSTGAFSLTNIPQTYTHLQIRVYARSTYNSSENLFMRINNVTTSFWSGNSIYGNGSSVAQASYFSSNYADLTGIPNAAQSSNVFGAYIIDILDYSSSSKNKTIKIIGGYDANGSGLVDLRSALASTTAPITDIHQLGGTAVGTYGLVDGSRIDLYGITSNPIATGA